MYPDLYKGLGLNPEDLSKYDVPLVGFDGKIVTPKGVIRLLVQTRNQEVKVDFIVMDVYSPILARSLLGSKDLGFYVFRTLICIVGKP